MEMGWEMGVERVGRRDTVSCAASRMHASSRLEDALQQRYVC